MVGVWPDPVTAHVMMTLRAAATVASETARQVNGVRMQRTSRALAASYETLPDSGSLVKTLLAESRRCGLSRASRSVAQRGLDRRGRLDGDRSERGEP